MTAWIFGLQIARSWWNTSLMAPLFVVSAVLSGTALVTLLALCAERFGKVELAAGHAEVAAGLHRRQPLRRPCSSSAPTTSPSCGATSRPTARHSTSCCRAAPGRGCSGSSGSSEASSRSPSCSFPRLKKMPGALGLAAFLVIVGVYAFRIELVVLGFVNPLTQYPPGNAVGTYNAQTTSFQLIGRYHPTWVEYGIVIGLVALFAALVTIGYRSLHVMEPSPAAGHRHARGAVETQGKQVMTATPASNGAGDLSWDRRRVRRLPRPSPARTSRGRDDHRGRRPARPFLEPAADRRGRHLGGGTRARSRDRHRASRRTLFREPVRVPGLEDVPALLEEYERLFVGPGQVPCPPYESFWREDVPVDIRRTLMGPCTADLKRAYLDLGLQVSSSSGELPDHVAIELEALAYALSFEETAPVARQLFEEHLAQWLPRLCRAVAHEAEEGFYRDLAVLTLDWLAAIKGYFAVAESG